MMKKMLSDFKDPGSEYRGTPFWAWNGKLEPGTLRKQISIFERMGMGGFFMHSRVGLSTPYLGKEWFDCIKACIDEAKLHGMAAWLYDEDRWPSGAAGGIVTKNPKYRMKFLVLEQSQDTMRFKWSKDIIAAFVAKLDGNKASDIRTVNKGQRPTMKKGETLLVFKRVLMPCSNWYNGYSYLDTMDPAAVKEFIKVTHEKYKQQIGKEFGKTVPGIFTDEPNHEPYLFEEKDGTIRAPWTDKLPLVFKKRYGYDILPHLIEVFFDVDGKSMSQARYHYHDCTTFLFVDSFAGQIGKWCSDNGLLFTGHVLDEDSLSLQTEQVGSCMRFYEHMQAPGMDLLTEHWRVWDTAKQVSSAARQFGRKWRITETYGCTGWDFPFEGHKAIGDWQTALGINLRCQHLCWYTMEGETKRDYPASIFFQSPWWEAYSKVEDYFARVHLAITQGKEVRDLLVIHPVESMWTMVRKGWKNDPKVLKYDTTMPELRDRLLGAHLDFDYGDEEILSRKATVVQKDGKTILKVGQAVYNSVLVPELRTIRSSTVRLLRKFRDLGGMVVFLGKPPGYVDAVTNKEAKEVAKDCIITTQKGMTKILGRKARRVSICDKKGAEIEQALYLLREDEDAVYLFVCNTGYDEGQKGPNRDDKSMARDRKRSFPDVRVRGFKECKGRPIELDPDTGKMYSAEAREYRQGWEVRTSLPKLGSRLFMFPKAQQKLELPGRTPWDIVRTEELNLVDMPISLSEKNVLILDRPTYRLGNEPMQPALEILKVDYTLRDRLGIPRRRGNMMQPWARKADEHEKKALVGLSYSFKVKALPKGPLYLALERPETFTLRLNGRSIFRELDSGWWCDPALRKIPIDATLLRIGDNTLELECEYSASHSGLEIIYLLGDFGVVLDGNNPSIIKPPKTLRSGDWTAQGLPFYSGNVRYDLQMIIQKEKGKAYFIKVPQYLATALKILVNNREAGIIAWEPNELDVTELVHDGTNDICIELLGHRRNSHGPLHASTKWFQWTGPAQFVTTDDKWTDDYQLVPCGLLSAPELVEKRPKVP